MTASVSQRLNIQCIYNVQDYSFLDNNAVRPVVYIKGCHYSFLDNNAVRPVVYKGCHFTHTWETLAMSTSFY
jgi:hypothetical protein